MHEENSETEAFTVINTLKAFNNKKDIINSIKDLIFKIIHEENKLRETI